MEQTRGVNRTLNEKVSIPGRRHVSVDEGEEIETYSLGWPNDASAATSHAIRPTLKLAVVFP
jgi:hypothetical protein